MSFSDFLREFLEYFDTADYRKGLYVEFSGIAIDLLLLSFLVPLFIWLLNLGKSSRAKSMASFYTLQFLNEAVKILLRLGGTTDTTAELRAALERGQMHSLTNHSIYGNTEDLLTLLKIRLLSGEYIAGHRSLDSAAVRELAQRAQELLNKLDQHIFLFNAVGLAGYSKKFFDARMFFYPLRDYVADIEHKKIAVDWHNDFMGLSTTAFEFTRQWFFAEKKRPDTIFRWRERLSFFWLLLRLPYVLIYRVAMPFVSRLRKKAYLDPSGTNFFSIMLRQIVSNSQLNEEEIADHLNLPRQLLAQYKLGYKRPAHADQVSLLLLAMDLVPEQLWNSLVVCALQADITNQKPTLATVNAVKANALVWFCRLVKNVNQSESGISEIFWNLFQLKPFK